MQRAQRGHDVLLTPQPKGLTHRHVIGRSLGLLPQQSLLAGIESAIEILGPLACPLDTFVQHLGMARFDPVASPVAMVALDLGSQVLDLRGGQAAHQSGGARIGLIGQGEQAVPDLLVQLAGLLLAHVLQRQGLHVLQPLCVARQLGGAMPLLVALQVLDQERALIG